MAMQDTQEAVNAMTFPKVSVQSGSDRYPGHLTEVSAKVILVELERQGFMLVKRTDQQSGICLNCGRPDTTQDCAEDNCGVASNDR